MSNQFGKENVPEHTFLWRQLWAGEGREDEGAGERDFRERRIIVYEQFFMPINEPGRGVGDGIEQREEIRGRVLILRLSGDRYSCLSYFYLVNFIQDVDVDLIVIWVESNFYFCNLCFTLPIFYTLIDFFIIFFCELRTILIKLHNISEQYRMRILVMMINNWRYRWLEINRSISVHVPKPFLSIFLY